MEQLPALRHRSRAAVEWQELVTWRNNGAPKAITMPIAVLGYVQLWCKPQKECRPRHRPRLLYIDHAILVPQRFLQTLNMSPTFSETQTLVLDMSPTLCSTVYSCLEIPPIMQYMFHRIQKPPKHWTCAYRATRRPSTTRPAGPTGGFSGKGGHAPHRVPHRVTDPEIPTASSGCVSQRTSMLM